MKHAKATQTASVMQTSAEEALRASVRRLRALVAASSDIVFRLTADGSEIQELDGEGLLANHSEATGIWIERHIHRADRAKVRSAFEEAVRSVSMVEFEHSGLRADGSVRTMLSCVVPIHGEDGQVGEFIGSAREITGRREQEEHYRHLADGIDQGLCIVEVMLDADDRATDFRFIETNRQFAAQTGLEDAVGTTMRELAPDHEEVWLETLGRVALTGIPERFDGPAVVLGKGYDVHAFRIGAAERRRVGILFRAIGERKQAELALHQSEEKYRALFDSMDEAFAAVEVLKDGDGAWVDFRFTDANPAFLKHTSMNYPVGKTATELLGSPSVRWARLYGQALDSGKPMRIEEIEPKLGRTFDVNIFSLDRERSRVAVLFTDITERKRSEIALRKSEERLRAIFEQAPMAIALTGPEGEILLRNAMFDQMLGRQSPAINARSYSDVYRGYDMDGRPIPSQDWPAARAVLTAEIVQGEVIEIVNHRGERVPCSFDAGPIRDAEGQVVGAVVMFRDVAGEFAARRELQDSEARHHEILESISDAFYAVDSKWCFTYVNGKAEEMWERSRENILGKAYVDEFPQVVGSDVHKAHLRAARTREVVRLEARSPLSLKWLDIAISPSADGGLAVYFRDISERHAAQERQNLLLAELQHRVRNILSMIRSVVRQSSEGYSDAGEFVAHLDGRLAAIARTQVLLTRSAGAQVLLEDLVRDELSSQLADQDRVRISGPEVSLSPKAAEVLTLALHELATNSVKFGALSDPGGDLSITWGQAPLEGQLWLQLTWEERCQQLEPKPIKAGFGTELIEQRVPYELRGEASLHVTGGGVRAEIAFPLTDIASILETGPARGASR